MSGINADTEEILASLAGPFDERELDAFEGRWNPALSRKEVFVTFDARAAMSRFDEVLPGRWRDSYRKEQAVLDGEVVDILICRIELKLDGEWVGREAGATFREMLTRERNQATGQSEQVKDVRNTVKTAFTEAFKLCAVKWGVGRYLYRKGVPRSAEKLFHGPNAAWIAGRAPDGLESRLVGHAPRGGGNSGGGGDGRHGDQYGPGPASASTRNGSQSGGGGGGGGNSNQPPRTGKALFAWIKQAEQRHGSGLLTYINEWASAQGYAGRMVEWSPTVVSEAYLEAVAAIQRSLDEEAIVS